MPRGVYERGEASRLASAQKMTAIMQRRVADEPERVGAISSENGTTACSYVYQCDDCGRVFNGPSVHYHQKQRGHVGLTLLARPNAAKETE